MRYTVVRNASLNELDRVKALLEEALVGGYEFYRELAKDAAHQPDKTAFSAFVRALDPGLLSAFAAVDAAQEAIREGAFFSRDVPPEELEERADGIAEQYGLGRIAG